jgi:DNA polymerase-1
MLYGGVELANKPDLENVRKLDLLCIPQIARMERCGFAIDLPALAELSSQLSIEMADLQRDISSFIPPAALDRFASAALNEDDDFELNANSAPQIRTLLFELLGIGRGRDLKQTPQGLVSTGKKTLELCRDDHPVVAKVLAYRERSKLKSAFCDSLPKFTRFHPRGPSCPVCELSHETDQHRVHGQIMTTRAETGRLSMKKPNLMQIPVRSDLGGRIRACFVAPPGKRLVSVDFSQAELRDLAHLANAASMIDVYRRDLDIHIFTACMAFGLEYDKYEGLSKKKQAGTLSKEESVEWKHFSLYNRLPAKNVAFGTVYGISWMGLQAQLALSQILWDEQQCKDFIARWFGLYPEVEEYLRIQEYRARRYGFVWTPCGRVRLVPEIRSCHSYIRSAGIRQAGNMPIQGCNAEQTKLVMGELEEEFIRLYDGGTYVWPLLPVHDQIIAEADEESAEMIGTIMEYVFSNVMVDKQSGENLWRVPIKADYEIMEKWIKS